MKVPQIDKRTDADIAALTEALVQYYTDWRSPADGQTDGGRGLVRLFAHLAGLTRDRLNRIPEKNFLEFLNLIGTQAQPPQPDWDERSLQIYSKLQEQPKAVLRLPVPKTRQVLA